MVADREPTTATDDSELVEAHRAADPQPEGRPAAVVAGSRSRSSWSTWVGHSSSPGTTNLMPSALGALEVALGVRIDQPGRDVVLHAVAGVVARREVVVDQHGAELGHEGHEAGVAGLAQRAERHPGQPLPVARPSSGGPPAQAGVEQGLARAQPERGVELGEARLVDPVEVGDGPGEPVHAGRAAAGEPTGVDLVVDLLLELGGERPLPLQDRAGRLGVEPPAAVGVALELRAGARR